MFLEKYAKLNSTIDVSGSEILVQVFDDELDGDTPVMWIEAIYTNNGASSNKQDATGIYFTIIDFDNDLFKKMPQNRQDSTANAALKRFIRWYMGEHGRDSESWLPVYANFANYKIQQKFEQAIEKGIFPPESLEMSRLTTKEKWKSDPYYNRENRQSLDQMKEDFENGNIEDQSIYQGFSDGFLENVPVSKLQKLLAQYDSEHVKIEGYIEIFGEVIMVVPNVGNSDGVETEDTYFAITGNTVTFDPLDFDPNDSYNSTTPIALRVGSNIRTVFDTITTVKFGSQGEEMTIDQWLQTPTEANKKSRLKKRGR